MKMKRAKFKRLMTQVFDFMQIFHPGLRDADFRELVAEIIWDLGVEDSEDIQDLRGRVKSVLKIFKERPGPLEWWPQ